MSYSVYTLPPPSCSLHVCCVVLCGHYLLLFSVLFFVIVCPCDPHVCHPLCHPIQTQWHSIMNTSEHNKLMVTIHYCLGIAVWHQRREDYIVTAMTHFRTITTRYSSVIFVPAYYHLGMANAALHQ